MRNLFIFLLLFSIFFFCRKSEEPTYESKPLSQWIKDLKDASIDTRKKAQEALVVIGTPSIPYMEKILKKSKDSNLKIHAACVLYRIGEYPEKINNYISKLKSEEESLFKEIIESNYKYLLLEINSYEESVNQAWTLVENQLQRRYDLIPNYIGTIEKFIPKETESLLQIFQIRKSIDEAKTVLQKIDENNRLSNALSKLSDVLNNYPKLSKNHKFNKLQDHLISIENRIAIERRRYNESVMNFNKKIKQLPFPELFNYRKIDYYGINSE